MELDIVFNIDYPSDNGIGLLYSEVPKYIQYIQVSDFGQFRRLINCLQDDVTCYIWLHPSLSAKRVQDGYKSQIVSECVPELNKHNIEFTQITRSTGKSSSETSYVDVDTMLDRKKHKKYYTASSLKLILKVESPIRKKSEPRERLKNSFKSDVKTINERLGYVRTFFNEKSKSEGKWYHGIFDLKEEAIDAIFKYPYWAFPNSIYTTYLNLNNLLNPIINENELSEKSIIRFNQETKQWHIDISFFDEVSFRFESMKKDYSTKLSIATCLYVLHEAIHKIHNLDCNSVEGIGNFPRIVEEADYQADSIAILSELAYQIFTEGGLIEYDTNKLVNSLCDIIEIAIETTFSFNPIQEELKLIQVRRVNRYLIWFFHYFKLKNYLLENLNAEQVLEKILIQFSCKPLIEITGPAIRSNRESNRTFYDLDSIKHQEEVAILKINNEIIRMGKTQSINFNELYGGMKKSDFQAMFSFMQFLFSNNKYALA
jgi:hypothetical protein